MPRKIEISTPSGITQDVVAELKELDKLIDLQVLKGVSANSPGDVIKVTIPTSELQKLIRRMDKLGLGQMPNFSLSTSEPDSLISAGYNDHIDRDGTAASWEEMEMIISKDSNANSMLLFLMVASGILAAVGIATNAIHIVIGGMLVAPGFMPIMRISLGLVSGSSPIWKRGVSDTLLAYVVLIIVAAITTFIMKASGMVPLPGKADYYELSKPLVSYWTTITATSVAASAAACLAGSVLIASKRSVFTSGVMIALALVPSASLVGMALVMGDTSTAGQAMLRFLTDVGLILVISFCYFSVLKAIKLKRNMSM